MENKRAERKLMAWEGVSAGDKFLYELGVTTPDGGRAYLDLNHLEYSSPNAPIPTSLSAVNGIFPRQLPEQLGVFGKKPGKGFSFSATTATEKETATPIT